jgi:hypothetical protein
LRGTGRCATVDRMTRAGEPTRLGLEVRFDAQPIRGRVFVVDGEGALDRPFSGWLGLMAAIEAARHAALGAPSESRGMT